MRLKHTGILHLNNLYKREFICIGICIQYASCFFLASLRTMKDLSTTPPDSVHCDHTVTSTSSTSDIKSPVQHESIVKLNNGCLTPLLSPRPSDGIIPIIPGRLFIIKLNKYSSACLESILPFT